MNKTATSLVLVSGLASVAGIVSVGTADAAPHAFRAVACEKRDPVRCLDRYGEVVAEGLSEADIEAVVERDATCADAVASRLGACLDHTQRIADLALDGSAPRCLPSIDNDEQGHRWRDQLESVQQAWLGFREADGGGPIGSEGRSGTGTAFAICRLGQTQGRTEGRTAELDRRTRR